MIEKEKTQKTRKKSSKKERNQFIKGKFIQLLSAYDKKAKMFSFPFFAYDYEHLISVIAQSGDMFDKESDLYVVGYFDIKKGLFFGLQSKKPDYLMPIQTILTEIDKRKNLDVFGFKERESEVKYNGNSSDKVTSCT